MFSKTFLVFLLSALATAAPTNKRDANSEAFDAITIHTGNQAVHISASDSYFYIGKNTTTYCPSDVDCSTYSNDTSFVAIHSASAVPALRLNTAVSGVQHVFVLADGALTYGTPGEAAPWGASVGPFDYTPGSDDGSVGSLTFEEDGFFTCPVVDEDFVYQLYVAAVTPEGADRSACVDVAIGTANYAGAPAYEYSN